MESRTRHEHGATVAVVAWMSDVLKIERNENSSNQSCRVVRLHYFFAAIGQSAVAEQKAFSTELQVSAVIAGGSGVPRCKFNPVAWPGPRPALKVAAGWNRTVCFRLSEKTRGALLPP